MPTDSVGHLYVKRQDAFWSLNATIPVAGLGRSSPPNVTFTSHNMFDTFALHFDEKEAPQ